MNTYPREQCCFATGHRDMPEHLRSSILGRIRETAEYLISVGVTHFYAGGANGFDMWFACVILDLKQKYPHVTLTILLPDKDYSRSWTAEDRLCNRQICALADEVETVKTSVRREPALVRNDALIARGAHCVAYLKGNRITRRGGTSYTVSHARRAGCKLYLLALPQDDAATPFQSPRRPS